MDDFPWEAGAFDAHCHPTDTMASIEFIPSMKARVLTIMATRSQDQSLVAEVAQKQAIHEPSHLISPISDRRIIPAFGWHPWFSHQLYDDMSPGASKLAPSKAAHYSAVLNPSVENDTGFVASLPDHRPLSSHLEEMRSHLKQFPAALVGEIGLDKAFRLPTNSPAQPKKGATPGSRDGRALSSYRVKMEHQISIFKAQLTLAGELGRPVSVHGVQAHGVVYDTLASTWKGYEKTVLSKRQLKRIAPGAEDWSTSDEDDIDKNDGLEGNVKQSLTKLDMPFPPRICLHSFSGPPQMVKQYLNPRIPAAIYFSFSVYINFSNDEQANKTKAVLEAVPDDKILVESDLHTAGIEMDEALEQIYRFICDVKKWNLKEGIERIRRNFRMFIFGQQ